MTGENTAVVWACLLLVTVVGTLFTGYPVALCLAGASLLVAWLAALFGAFDLALLNAIPQRLFAILNNDLLIAVPLFIFMGSLLERSQVAARLLTTLSGLFGARHGGLGYAVLLVGALLAASTGIVGATVVTLGVLSLPTMLRNGYSPRLASGLVCASGTLGQIIPPSIVLVLLGDQLASAWQQSQFARGNYSPDAISVNDLFAAALLPGLILVSLYAIYLAVIVRWVPSLAPPVTESNLTPRPTARQVIEDLCIPLILIVAVLGSILFGVASPTEAAALGALGALLISALQIPARGLVLIRLTLVALLLLAIAGAMDIVNIHVAPKTTAEGLLLAIVLILCAIAVAGIGLSLWRTNQDTAASDDPGTIDPNDSTLVYSIIQTLTVSCMIFTLVIGASIFTLILRGLGGDEVLHEWLTGLPGGAMTLLLATMLAIFLLGFILDFVEIIYIVVPIVVPILLSAEIAPGVTFNPLWLGVMIAMNLQTSFLTPPFGFALFYLRGVAPASVTLGDIYRGCIPFVIIQLLMLAILWWMPSLATWLPDVVQ